MEGNQMKMREALLQCERFLGNVLRHGHPMFCFGDQCTACNGADELMGVVVSALAEPPRNCDIYTTSEEADRAITEHCSKMAETGECVKSCPHREAKGGCAFGWLLSATGTKGANDGSK